MAEMLSPMRHFSNGCLQPFRFIALGDDDHRKLRMAVDAVVERNFLSVNAAQIWATKSS
jgi:hypothetical protein